MNVLCLGDVIGEIGCSFLSRHLKKIKLDKGIDLTIANGENSAKGNGLNQKSVDSLFSSGVDIITTGNHCFKRWNSVPCYENNRYLLRPLNFPKFTPGHGFCVWGEGETKVCVINLIGTVFMESMSSPFEVLRDFLNSVDYNVIIVDFHAEATAEKRALACYMDGKVSAIFGTHTHVQTADEMILSHGTGFISDVGMCGPIDSVLGVKSHLIIKRFLSKMPVKFEEAEGQCQLNGIIFNIDTATGKTKSVERIQINT